MRSTLSIVAASAAVAMLLPVASAEHGLVGACKAKNYTAVDIDVEKYVGRWYEMSRSKSFFFDNGCFCTQAAYTPNSDGTLKVVNSCRKKSITGQETDFVGTATIPDQNDKGHLMVTFKKVPFAKAPYDVVYVDDDYSVAAIVSCDSVLFYASSNVWILSRTPTLDQDKYEKVINSLQTQGFELGDLEATTQHGCYNSTAPTEASLRGSVAVAL